MQLVLYVDSVGVLFSVWNSNSVIHPLPQLPVRYLAGFFATVPVLCEGIRFLCAIFVDSSGSCDDTGGHVCVRFRLRDLRGKPADNRIGTLELTA